MLRAFQSGPVAKQFGKLVGRGGPIGGVSDAERGLEDSYLEGVEEGGAEDGAPDSEGFSAADRLLGAVSIVTRKGMPLQCGRCLYSAVEGVLLGPKHPTHRTDQIR